MRVNIGNRTEDSSRTPLASLKLSLVAVLLIQPSTRRSPEGILPLGKEKFLANAQECWVSRLQTKHCRGEGTTSPRLSQPLQPPCAQVKSSARVLRYPSQVMSRKASAAGDRYCPKEAIPRPIPPSSNAGTYGSKLPVLSNTTPAL
jgi:hypothetical protein